jgi:hypothetical protein
MLPNLEASAAAAKIDRALILKAADRRALQLATATPPRPTSAAVPVATVATQWRRLVEVNRLFRAVRRPVPA